MEDTEMEEELYHDPIFKVIMSAIQESEKTAKILNPRRYAELLIARAAIDSLLRQNGEATHAEIKFHHAFSSASICAEVDSLEVRDMAAFSIAMGKANNFEFYPLTNGKIKLAFTFQHVLIPIE